MDPCRIAGDCHIQRLAAEVPDHDVACEWVGVGVRTARGRLVIALMGRQPFVDPEDGDEIESAGRSRRSRG